MDAIFFLSCKGDACRATDSERLPGEAVADPLPIGHPRILGLLAESLGAAAPPAQLRDATCQSFPVWKLGREVARRIEAMDCDVLDDVAERWHAKAGEDVDADVFELTTLLRDLRDAVQRRDPDTELFVLLEERAW